MKNRQPYILIGAGLLIGGLVYAGANRRRKKALIDEIYAKLEKEPPSGVVKAAVSAFNPNYWKQIKESGTSTVYLTKEAAERNAKQIYDAMNKQIWQDDDEDAVYAVYKRLRNLVQASQVAYYFNMKHKKDLSQYLKDKLSASERNIIQDILKTKPEY